MKTLKNWLAERLIIIRPLLIGIVIIIAGAVIFFTYWFINHPVKDYQLADVVVPRKEKVSALRLYSKEEAMNRIRLIAESRSFKFADYLIRLVDCESSFNQFAINKVSSATGWYQIIDAHKLTRQQRYDLDFATNWAIDKINAGGQKIWECDKLVKK